VALIATFSPAVICLTEEKSICYAILDLENVISWGNPGFFF
jgi:hypothetical protein